MSEVEFLPAWYTRRRRRRRRIRLLVLICLAAVSALGLAVQQLWT